MIGQNDTDRFARGSGRPRVVIVGGGFGGLWAARRLARSGRVDVVLVDRNNYHTFLPLLYQVAAAEIEPEQIAYPLRGVFRRQDRVSVALAEVRGVDGARRVLHTDGPDIPYDHLILAPGSLTSFFGVPGAAENAYTLKSLEDAVRLRNHILACFERASLTEDPARRAALLTFTVVGGGPTGVEFAGALAELVRTPLARDFPELAGKTPARIVLLEAADGLLTGFPEQLRTYARDRLALMGVEVRTKAGVAEVGPTDVRLGDGMRIATCTVAWTAGVRGHDVAAAMGLPVGRGGRVSVLPTLQVDGHPEIHVVGDLSLPEGQNPPMIAPNATQQGRHAASNVLRLLQGGKAKVFRYRDKGAMATIGRQAAVVRLGRFAFSGLWAWVLWLFVHLAYLIGFRNRLFVLVNWAWDYLFFERSVRLILPRVAMDDAVCEAPTEMADGADAGAGNGQDAAGPKGAGEAAS